MSNLMQINFGQFMYAMDWNGRQYSAARDELGYYGDHAAEALVNYEQTLGPHPPIYLGWTQSGLTSYPLHGVFIAGNASLVLPAQFDDDPFGNHRFTNVKAVHDYVTGRFYDPVYYPPNDSVAYNAVEPLFDSPYEFLSGSMTPNTMWSSYCFSAAAWYDPDVLRAPSEGGYQDPFELGYGLQTPAYDQVLYSDLKTHVIEHNWNQNAPVFPCNPHFLNGTYDGCEPYYFNHGIESSPVALFYDGHIRLLPNKEAFNADAQVRKQSGGVDGLWSRDTPMGSQGYYGQYAFDGLELSHHVLTTDGIRGRDTLSQW